MTATKIAETLHNATDRTTYHCKPAVPSIDYGINPLGRTDALLEDTRYGGSSEI